MHPDVSNRLEEWRPVVDFEGFYSVSSEGHIRRDRPGGCSRVGRIVQPTLSSGGYPIVSLYKHAQRFGRMVHTLVAAAFLGPRPVGEQVNHRDGVKANNRAQNLEYATPAENSRHAARLGNWPSGDRHVSRINPAWVRRGEQVNLSRLTESQVRAIRAAYAQGSIDYTGLGAAYGVTPGTIGSIVLGKTWKHLL